jgi:uncharacterized protein YqjF (DUF2071 family)
MTQTWHDLLFAHWTVDVARLRAKVPGVFELDLHDGQAWIGVVPFYMANVSVRGVPSLPFVSEFPELNVRTYVSAGGKPGVYFFSLDAGSALAVKAARVLLNLPYFTASMRVDRVGSRVRYASSRPDSRADLIAEYEPSGPPSPSARGSLEHFLTERYCLYHIDRRGRPYRLDIHHPPWPLQPAIATLTRNTMADAASISLPDQAPLLHFSKRQDVVTWGKDLITVP